MRHFFLFFLTVCLAISLYAQKPPISSVFFDRWPSVWEPKISNNGKYVMYKINNEPAYGRTMVIQSVDDNWREKIPGVELALFSDDSRKALFIQGEDSLCLLTLGSNNAEYICPVSNFQIFKQGDQEWLAYQSNTPERKLVLRNMRSKKIFSFTGVMDYIVSKSGTILLFKVELIIEGVKTQVLRWANIHNDGISSTNVIWQGTAASNYIFDASDTRLAFITEEQEGEVMETTIWHYRLGAREATEIANSRSVDKIDSNLKIGSLSYFSIDGERLFFHLREKDFPQMDSGAVKVDAWSYIDAKIQSQQLVENVADYGGYYIGPRDYLAIIELKNHSILRLQQKNEEIIPISNGKVDDWVLIIDRNGDKREENWNKLSQPLYYLMSIKTGCRKAVSIPLAGLSPGGKYLIGDDGQGNFFSYELATETMRNISESIPAQKLDIHYDEPYRLHHRGLSFWGHWLEKDAAMFMYDRYDIWKVDPRGVKNPVNLTNGYGRQNNITFKLISDASKTYTLNDRLILSAFNMKNKDNGFYSITLDRVKDPTALTMGPYTFYAPPFLEGERPIKARDSESYIVYRGSASESPNYFWTNNFKRFIPLSDTYPERRFNWFRSELVKFMTLDGREEQGILYKPENFDSRKKYPVIICYYETKSEALNQYFRPGFSDGNINIPYFVSKGYLVFTPDIHYTIGKIGESAYNSIVAAGKYLARLPWVDEKRIGITGHSFGGFETNYIITHSNLFAAACSDAGVANFISQYGSYELSTGISLQSINEVQQNRMGTSLWDSTNWYVKNSPVFYADKVTTPLLLVNNKLDAIVHFSQGIQFFTALKSLNKRVWMLQYDGERHSLLKGGNIRDLSIRITQFFDHYLKGVSVPKWMEETLPAKLKGINNGLDYNKKAESRSQIY